MQFGDCDGISTALFCSLAKVNRRMESARLFIPSTVVFDHGFASAWFYSTENMEVKRYNTRDIKAEEILKDFCQSTHPHAAIVAVFMSTPKSLFSLVDKDNSRKTETKYFTKSTLRDFLFSPGEKPRGILQKFEYPKGLHSTSVQCAWSPSLTITEAVRNPNSLFDHTKSLSERAGTHESNVSHQVSTTNSVALAVRQLCQLIVQHVYQVEHITVTGMVLYFKVAHNNRVLFLYSISLRVATPGIPNLPLNMDIRFVGETEQQKLRDERIALELRRLQARPTLPPLSMTSTAQHTVFSQSSLYKAAAQRLLESDGAKFKSRLVAPAFLGRLRHTGMKWASLNLDPLPITQNAAPPAPPQVKAETPEPTATSHQPRPARRVSLKNSATGAIEQPGGIKVSDSLAGTIVYDDEDDDDGDADDREDVLNDFLYSVHSAYLNETHRPSSFVCRFSEDFVRSFGEARFRRLLSDVASEIVPEGEEHTNGDEQAGRWIPVWPANTPSGAKTVTVSVSIHEETEKLVVSCRMRIQRFFGSQRQLLRKSSNVADKQAPRPASTTL